jgi:acetolactate synthase I/II/III large subunit
VTYTVGDLTAEFLSACNVTTVFGIVSVHNIPILDGIGRRNAIRFVTCRGEMGGGHMADAYARASGGLGVLITSTGPGAANAVSALVEARIAGSPVLHITAQTDTRHIDRDMGTVHNVPGQSKVMEAVCKASFRIHTPAEALGVLCRAAAEALSAPLGPVTVEIPVDVQRAPVPRPAALDRLVLPLRTPQVPAAADLDAAAELLRTARRPLLWLGSGARHAGKAALALLDMGFGCVSSWSGRGTVAEDHPRTLGALNGNGSPDVEAFYGGVDAMIVAGSRLRGFETLDFTLKLPKSLIHIDTDPLAQGRTYASEIFVCGDAALALDGLAHRLRGTFRADTGFGDDIARVRQKASDAYRKTLGPYGDFAQRLRDVLPRDTIWVRDATMAASTWGHRLMQVYSPRDSIYPAGAAIGPGLPFGVGAALAAAGRKTVVLTGDGGFAVNMAELWTAVDTAADLCVIVMNDSRYAAIQMIQDAQTGGRRFFSDLRGPDFVKLAALAGMPAWRVSTVAGLGDAVGRALSTPGPSLIDVDMNAIGPQPPYGVWAKASDSRT